MGKHDQQVAEHHNDGRRAGTIRGDADTAGVAAKTSSTATLTMFCDLLPAVTLHGGAALAGIGIAATGSTRAALPWQIVLLVARIVY